MFEAERQQGTHRAGCLLRRFCHVDVMQRATAGTVGGLRKTQCSHAEELRGLRNFRAPTLAFTET